MTIIQLSNLNILKENFKNCFDWQIPCPKTWHRNRIAKTVFKACADSFKDLRFDSELDAKFQWRMLLNLQNPLFIFAL